MEKVEGITGDADLRQIFDKFDVDGSGDLDEYEVRQAMKMLGCKHVTQTATRNVLQKIDGSNKGRISWEEFQSFFKEARGADQIKDVLAKHSVVAFEYQQLVRDASFTNMCARPPSTPFIKRFEWHGDTVAGVEWLSDERLVSVGMDGEMMIWNVASRGKRPSPEKTIKDMGKPLYCMSACSSGDEHARILIGQGTKADNLKLWNISDDAHLMTLKGHDNEVYSCIVSPDNMAISGSKSGVVCLHDLQSETALHILKCHKSVVYGCSVDRGGKILGTCSADGSVKVFDLRSFAESTKPTHVIEEGSACGTVYDVVLGPDNSVLSGGDDFCIKRWDFRAPAVKLSTTYIGHSSNIRSLALSPDDNWLASAADDGGIRLWPADETSTIERELKFLRDEDKRIDSKIRIEQGRLSEGEKGAVEEIRELVSQKEKFEKRTDHVLKVRHERQDLQCTQAKLALDGHRTSVVSMTWRELANGDTMLASASVDQSVRLFKVDKKKLESLDLWEKE
eukprot:TRINITY_DN49122_c0_g1_i1.p1 TRINITY_DN49122_c0_g1~~TRINITY_DN49122_c0_g1_i1.p1  ORF type:complete len:530 (-),score=120.33 TRINITY_DN49122_c0_g1_i1:151-1674(-)